LNIIPPKLEGLEIVNPSDTSLITPWILRQGIKLVHFPHRDKTRVQMPAKIFPHLKVKCWQFMGPSLGFDTEERNSFLIKLGVFFTIKTRF
jgi:hypothetical protein